MSPAEIGESWLRRTSRSSERTQVTLEYTLPHSQHTPPPFSAWDYSLRVWVAFHIDMLLRGWDVRSSPTAFLAVLVALFIAPSVVSLASESHSTQLRRGPTGSSFALHHFSLQQLQAPTSSVLRRLEDAIFNVGMFVVTDADDGPTEPQDALAEFAHCAQQGHLYSQLKEVVLADGSIRSTLATKTLGGTAAPLPAAAEQSCPEFAAAARRLRASVDHTGQAYARLLDSLLYGPSKGDSTEASIGPDESAAAAAKGGAPGAGDAAAGLLGSAVLQSESLEHFHLFHQAGPHLARPALELHSDMGLFIVMTAAQFFSVDSGRRLEGLDSGLRLELKDGRVVAPSAPPGALLVMNGEGVARWMPAGQAGGGRVPYAPGHEVELPGDAGAARAWFGRMYLPPGNAVLQRSAAEAEAGLPGVTFAEYRAQAMSAFRRDRGQEASAAGCAPARGGKPHLADEGSCAADEIFCWMVCMKTAHLACGADDAVCRSPSGLLWPDDFKAPDTGQVEHCSDCTVQCRGAADAPDDPSAAELCNTNLTAISMFMQGFQTTGRHHGPCLVFLFPQLPLTTWLRFAAACLGTFLMGVCSGGLSWASRMAQRRTPAKAAVPPPPPPRGGGAPGAVAPAAAGRLSAEALEASIYALRISLAYVLMLIAMSYQVELFIMVVAGLTVGHWYFNIRSDEEEDIVDPCCC